MMVVQQLELTDFRNTAIRYGLWLKIDGHAQSLIPLMGFCQKTIEKFVIWINKRFDTH